MQSRTFCFNGPLYKRTVLRLWPIWAAATVFFFFLVPATMWQNYNNGWSYLIEAGPSYYFRDYVYTITLESLPILVAIISCATGLFVWNWMFTARSVNAHFALPLRREGLFLTNYLAGLTVTLIPIVVLTVLTAFVELCFGGLELRSLMSMLGVGAGSAVLFFSLATLCAVATGNIVAMPVFFVILNALAYGIYFLIKWLASTFVFGMYTNYSAPGFVVWLTPIFNLMENCRRISGQVWVGDSFYSFDNGISNLGYYGIYAIAGVVLAAIALLAFRKRPAESAGDLIAFRWLRPVFQIGLALCFSMLMTTFIQEAYFYHDPQFFVTLVLIVLWGFVGYFGAEMLLRKSFRVFQTKTFRTWGIVMVCALMLLVMARLDVFGYERYIPDEAQVDYVTISGVTNEITTDYADAVRIHQAILDGERDDDGYVSVRLEYVLKSGRVTRRFYMINLDTPEFELLREWACKPETLIANAFGSMESPDQLNWFSVEDRSADFYVDIPGDSTDARTIYEALLRDFSEGQGDFDYRYGDEPVEALYFLDFSYFSVSYDPAKYANRAEYEDRVSRSWSHIYVTANMTHTVRALDALDLESYQTPTEDSTAMPKDAAVVEIYG